ncbi:DUF2975 domain-containing protein [Aquimarina algiphila]|uniref:DUF2975 domain-containing protein n=1 Tax=Aquimarina algiphila TaxID=2047982 RepID=UPI00232D1FC8|nr:DUF2975 domain-containing protein [Aquimarina algiphila]
MRLKMFGKKSLSELLFYCTWFIAFGYCLFLLFIAFSFITDTFLSINDNRFAIEIPFTGSFVKGQYESEVILSIIVFFVFYILFFYTLSLIFKTFKAEILFTKIAIKHLKYFAILNLFSPFVYVIILFIVGYSIGLSDLSTVFLHIMLGIFAWFIIAIFKEGFQLQEENELTI